MKTTELQINDWVMYRGKPRRITGLDESSVYFEKYCTECHKAISVIPVPLTTEILENNGWKKVGEDERTGVPVMQIEYDGNAFWWTGMNGECGCEDVENEDGEEKFVKVFSCVQVCYVHELQHALKLCRIEKEIKL